MWQLTNLPRSHHPSNYKTLIHLSFLHSRFWKTSTTRTTVQLRCHHKRCLSGRTLWTLRFPTSARVAHVRLAATRESGRCRWTCTTWRVTREVIVRTWISASCITTTPTTCWSGCRRTLRVIMSRTRRPTWCPSTRTGSRSRSWSWDCRNSWIGLWLCELEFLLLFDLVIYFVAFILLLRPDVYFVTVTQALSWISEPRPLNQLANVESWDCKRTAPSASKPCNISNKCALAFKKDNITDTRYMETCHDCPNKYPWLGDAEGSGIPGRDNYIYTADKDIVPEGQKKRKRRSL